VNVNRNIEAEYMSLLNRLCVDGDDEQHGSSVLRDISVLQAISRRIYMGKVPPLSPTWLATNLTLNIEVQHQPLYALMLPVRSRVQVLIGPRHVYSPTGCRRRVLWSRKQT
jgi:hypothetical protein